MATSPLTSHGPKEGQIAMQPLRSRRSPQKGTKSEVATSPRASRVSKGGRSCYITPTFPRIPRKGDNSRIACITPAFSGGQKRAERLRNAHVGVPTKGEEIGSCYIIPSLSGPKNQGKYCVLRGPRRKGDNIKIATLSLRYPRDRRGRNRYVTSVFSGGPSRGDKVTIAELAT